MLSGDSAPFPAQEIKRKTPVLNDPVFRGQSTNIEEVQDHATRWLSTYNNERPNMGVVGMIPIQKLKAAWILLIRHSKNGVIAGQVTIRKIFPSLRKGFFFDYR